MSVADRAEKAYRGQCNCAQAVLVTLRGNAIDEDTAMDIARGFGGGMGSLGLTCGALTGAAMAIGLRCAREKDAAPVNAAQTAESVRELFDRFIRLHGCTSCRELIGLDLTDPAQASRKHADVAYTDQCSRFVRDAVVIADDLIAAVSV